MSAAPTPDPIALSLAEARALATIAQGLDRRPARPRARDDAGWSALLRATIERIGCVQIDAISVVSRSHETVLFSRLGPYDPARLARLHHPDGWLCEYWAHAAAFLPVASLPHFRHVMERFRARDERPGGWAHDNREVLDRVLAAAAATGEVSARDFARPDGPRPEPWAWWGGKPDRRALDHLWTVGDLAVLRRDGFERVYAPAARALPRHVHDRRTTPEEDRRFLVATALRALGVAAAEWVNDYFRAGSTGYVPAKLAAAELERMTVEGLAAPATIDGVPGRFWLSPEARAALDRLRAGEGWPTLTTLLSPFDNLVWHRGKDEALWGFHYRLESYTPAAKRQYGYYTLPILHRGVLVGRLDPVLDRKAKVLTVRALHLEPGVRGGVRLRDAVARALLEFAAFLGAEETVVGNGDATGFAREVAAVVARG